MNDKEYIVRREGIVGRWGLGEVVSDGVYLFRDGFYNLTREELERKVLSMQKPKKSVENK